VPGISKAWRLNRCQESVKELSEAARAFQYLVPALTKACCLWARDSQLLMTSVVEYRGVLC